MYLNNACIYRNFTVYETIYTSKYRNKTISSDSTNIYFGNREETNTILQASSMARVLTDLNGIELNDDRVDGGHSGINIYSLDEERDVLSEMYVQDDGIYLNSNLIKLDTRISSEDENSNHSYIEMSDEAITLETDANVGIITVKSEFIDLIGGNDGVDIHGEYILIASNKQDVNSRIDVFKEKIALRSKGNIEITANSIIIDSYDHLNNRMQDGEYHSYMNIVDNCIALYSRRINLTNSDTEVKENPNLTYDVTLTDSYMNMLHYDTNTQAANALTFTLGLAGRINLLSTNAISIARCEYNEYANTKMSQIRSCIAIESDDVVEINSVGGINLYTIDEKDININANRHILLNGSEGIVLIPNSNNKVFGTDEPSNIVESPREGQIYFRLID